MAKLGPIFFSLLLLIGVQLGAAERPPEKQSFAVADGDMLRVETFAGSIKVTPSNDTARIWVTVHQEASSKRPETAERWLDDIEISYEQKDNVVAIVARHRGSGVKLDLGDIPTGVLRFEIMVPLRTELNLVTRRGSIEVGHDLQGSLRAQAMTGTIFCGRIQGSVSAEIEEGGITISRASGNVMAKVLRGDISVGTITGDATLETSHGSIDIFSAQQRLVAKASAGNISVSFPPLFGAEVELKTSGGDILVNLDPTSDCCIEASSTWGKVSTRLPVEARKGGNGQRQLAAKLNAGGPILRISAHGGNVVLTPIPSVE